MLSAILPTADTPFHGLYGVRVRGGQIAHFTDLAAVTLRCAFRMPGSTKRTRGLAHRICKPKVGGSIPSGGAIPSHSSNYVF